MSSVIDNLIVTLGLDAKDFEKNSDEAIKKLQSVNLASAQNQKAINEHSKRMAEGFNRAKQEAVSLVSVIMGAKGLGGFQSFMADMSQKQLSLANTSKMLAMSATDLKAWGDVVQAAGGKAESFQQAAQSMNDIALKLQRGILEPEVSAAVGALGLGDKLLDAKGNLRDINAIMLDVNKAMNSATRPDGTKWNEQQKRFFAQSLGINDDMFNMLRRDPAWVNSELETMRKLAGDTEEATKWADRLNKKWTELISNFGGLKTDAFTQWGDDAERLLKFLDGLVTDFRDLNKETDGWAVAIASAAASLAVLLPALRGVISLGGAAVGAGASGVAATGGALLSPLGIGAAALLWPTEANAGADIAPGAVLGGDTNNLSEEEFKSRFGVSRAEWNKKSNGSSGQAASLFRKLEQEKGLPPGLLDSVWYQESRRGKRMKSPAGAEGHFQFMPGTASRFSLKNPYNLQQSATAAAEYYAILLKMFGGDVNAALAGYNWGEGNVQKAKRKYGADWLSHAPRETRGYVSSITGMIRAGNAGNYTAGGGNNTTVTTSIQQMTVNTKATDAAGIARDIQAEMQKRQAVYGAALGMS